MKALLGYTLTGYRWAVVGWGLVLAILGGYLVPFYDTIAEQRAQWQQLMEAFPRELLVFFGDIKDIADPATYFHSQFFSYVPLLLGFFAILSGSSLIAELEENGQLELLLGQPISRLEFFASRFLALPIVILTVNLVAWLSLVIARPLSTRLTIGPLELLMPFFSLWALMVFFGTLSLLLSLILPARRAAAAAAGGVLVVGFFVSGLAQLDNRLEPLARLSPFNYYQGGYAINSLRLDWTLGLLGISLVFVGLAAWRFERKDLRVSGEGSWELPRLRPKTMSRAS